MKCFISVLMTTFFITTSYAYDHFYKVIGNNADGELLEGSAYRINANCKVSGNLIDKKGNSHSFEGRIYSSGKIVGETDDGEDVKLYAREW